MKKCLLTILIIISSTSLFGENAKIFLKQVELEKIYSSQVTSFLNKMFDEKDYYVFTDVQLINKPLESVPSAFVLLLFNSFVAPLTLSCKICE